MCLPPMMRGTLFYRFILTFCWCALSWNTGVYDIHNDIIWYHTGVIFLCKQIIRHQNHGAIHNIKIYDTMKCVCNFADLLVNIHAPTDRGLQSKIKYSNATDQPLHNTVRVKFKKPGFQDIFPGGQAIGCSDSASCDVKWKVGTKDIVCTSAFNYSCCRNVVTFSFWWSWKYVYVFNYRYFFLGGIYMFYVRGKGSGLLAFRLFGGSEDFQWYYQIAIPYRTWNHLAVTMKPGKLTTFLNGRYYGSRRKRTLKLDWYPGTNTLHPRFWLEETGGAYSFGHLQMWEGSKSVAFLWRLYYETLILVGRS